MSPIVAEKKKRIGASVFQTLFYNYTPGCDCVCLLFKCNFKFCDCQTNRIIANTGNGLFDVRAYKVAISITHSEIPSPFPGMAV